MNTRLRIVAFFAIYFLTITMCGYSGGWISSYLVDADSWEKHDLVVMLSSFLSGLIGFAITFVIIGSNTQLRFNTGHSK